MTQEYKNISMESYDYPLPDERIAKFPLPQRDTSKLLLYKGGEITEDKFNTLSSHLPQNSLLVFNNTRVIQARLHFQKESGASIEIFCLEPSSPADYALSFQSNESCVWDCLVGNSKKWKEGKLTREVEVDGANVKFSAERITTGSPQQIRFSWDNTSVTFARLLDAVGELPIPPYLNREAEESDKTTYQTVYSKIEGSVAAPTAGLHFTPEVFASLSKEGVETAEVTLHVGAGTFRPVKSETIGGHDMHTELISVPLEVIEKIANTTRTVIAVGTTSVRTLESLYHIGAALGREPENPQSLKVSQWQPYDCPSDITRQEAFRNIAEYLKRNNLTHLVTSTQIIIVPSYQFKVVDGIITNFHQPKSTLLLLVSAYIGGGEKWREIYDYALANNFRFLSYGDSSLLMRF
ncbi:MAG: S-adenosylmethionine:tRNA ribosyltransferase-isomerase [Muribaculaceae bacterium]|nr:S-adenosylmethionine:tRNA ribosyltransferase-isomerase [Muribaculaceae bacterium]